MISQALIGCAVLVALFLLVPGIVWLSTGSRRQAMEAARGYGVVCLILFVIPSALGCLVAGISLLIQR